MVSNGELKKCSRDDKCLHPDGPELNINDFHKNKVAIDGLNNQCKTCRHQYRLDNREEILKEKRAYYQANKKAVLRRNKKWVQDNEEQVSLRRSQYTREHQAEKSAYDRKYVEQNKEKISARNSQWAKDNRGKYNASAGRRRVAKMQRSAPWADNWKIRQFYIMSQKLSALYGIIFHVDHIVPLQGKTVSGLHIETNLQIITSEENSRKHNSFEPIFGV